MAFDPAFALLFAIGFVLLVFLLLYFVLAAFRGAGFTIGETLAILLLAPLLRDVNIPIYQTGNVVLALNVAGSIIPILVCARILAQHRAPFGRTLVATVIVSYVVYTQSAFIPNEGVAMNVVVPVLVAAIVGLVLSASDLTRAPLITYVAGAAGVLAGGDLIRLPQILALHPVRSELLAIGGAGTRDGIFVVAIAAVALEMVLFGLFGRRAR